MVQEKETLRIGKSGITSQLIQELKDQLRRKNQVTVKFMSNSVTDNKDFVLLANKLAKDSESKLIHKVGHTATYLKN